MLPAMRLRTALLLLFALLALHLAVDAAWVARIPAQEKTFHDHDLALVRHPMVLSGAGWAPELPVGELVPPSWPGLGPYDLFDGALRNSPDGWRSYRTLAPLHYLVSAVPAVVAGISPWTVRLGPLAVLALLLLAAFDTGRLLARRKGDDGAGAGLMAAAAVSLVPVGWLGVLVGVPTLGNLTGVALATWALTRSDGLRRLPFAVLAGVLVALSTRWGESVGDALACLAALAGPVAVSVALAVGRAVLRRQAWGLVGIALGGAAAASLLDLPWIENHLQGYVLGEADLSALPGSADLQARVAGNLQAYLRALGWSLLGPAGLSVVAVGGLGALTQVRRQPLVLVLLASPLSGLLALSLSAKGHDYYAAPVVPALLVLGGAGLWMTPKIGRGLAAAGATWLAASWLVTAHLDTAALSEVGCGAKVRTWLAGDPTRCDPRGGGEEEIYPWFREWRRKPGREVRGRRELGRWMMSGEGRVWVNDLPAGAVVLLQVPPGPGGGADVAHLLGQSLRPDVVFHRVEGGMSDPRSVALLSWARDQGRPVSLLTFAPRMHTRSDAVERPTGWYGPSEEVLRAERVGIYALP